MLRFSWLGETRLLSWWQLEADPKCIRRSHPMISSYTMSSTISMTLPLDPMPPLDDSSDPSSSPESLYSEDSPAMPEQAYAPADFGVEERDTEEYESLLHRGSHSSFDLASPSHLSPTASIYDLDDSQQENIPSPKSVTPRKLSIISISPRGSVSGGPRRASLLKTTLMNEQTRRASTTSIAYGKDIEQRRRSSSKSVNSSRRRSSAWSNGSSLDPTEEAKYRNFFAMENLARRFSELVDVTQPLVIEEQQQASQGDIVMARAALREWSPNTPMTPNTDASSFTDESEIHTASYAPTPDIIPTPGMVSNFPLASVAQQPRRVSVLDPLDLATPYLSPALPPRIHHHTWSTATILTPPAPPQPHAMLRARTRPSMPRSATYNTYQFPPRSTESLGPVQPTLNRSISTPFPSSLGRSGVSIPPTQLQVHNNQAMGSYTMARSVPLGISPLRASLRRQSLASVASEMASPRESRRASIEPTSLRASFAEPSSLALQNRRPASAALFGPSSPALDGSRGNGSKTAPSTRRTSLAKVKPIEVRNTSASTMDSRSTSISALSLRRNSSLFDLRRASIERRASQASSNILPFLHRDSLEPRVRQPSRSSASRQSDDRRKSQGSLPVSDARGSIASASSRKASLASRKSSVVSIGEYGYLGQMVEEARVDTPVLPPAPPVRAPQGVTPRQGKFEGKISLPKPFSMGLKGVVESPSTPTRFNPLEEFFGRPSPRDISVEATPKPSNTSARIRQVSVMDRPRPVAPPEFMDSFPSPAKRSTVHFIPESRGDVSPTSSTSASLTHTYSEPLKTPVPVTGARKTSGRKPVPQLSMDELHLGEERRSGKSRSNNNTTSSIHSAEVDPLHVLPPSILLRRASSLTSHEPKEERAHQRPTSKRQATVSSIRSIETGESGSKLSNDERPVRPRIQKQQSNSFMRFFGAKGK